jgi:hypothetical protein
VPTGKPVGTEWFMVDGKWFMNAGNVCRSALVSGRGAVGFKRISGQ